MVPTVRVIAMIVVVALVAGPLYAGGAVMVNREPATIDRNQVQWGFEARAPLWRSHVFAMLSNPVMVSPVLTADFKSNEGLN